MFPRRLIGLTLTLLVGWLPVAPPEHVHETDDHGDEHMLVHRHLAVHGFSHDRSGHDGVLDHDDAPILTLDTVYTVPTGTASLTAPASGTVTFGARPIAPLVARTPDYFARPIHGPPRAPTGLRAPPQTARL